jgi:hypothetical protein
MSRPRSRLLPTPHLFMVASVVLLTATALAGSAAGEVVAGTCTGTVTMEGQTIVDAQQAQSISVEIPDQGVAEIAGGFDVEPSGEPVAYRSELRGQHAFGSWVITSWTGESSTPEVAATQTYALPNFIPRGSGPIPVVLDVTFGSETCRIVGAVMVAGPTFDGLTIVMLVATLLLLAATAAAGRPGARGFGRPLVGSITGLLAGAAGAVTLFGAGVISLDSNVWWLAPLLFGVLGIALGAMAPFERRREVEERQLVEEHGGGSDDSDTALAGQPE